MSGRLTPGERSSRLDRPFQAALIARFPSTLLHPCPPHQQTLTTPPTPPQTHNKLHKRDSPPQNTHTAAVGGASAQDPTTPPSPPPSPPRPRPTLLNLAIFSCARTPPTPPYLTHHPPLRLPPACSRPHAAREDSKPSTHRPTIQHLATPHRPPTHLPLRRRARADDAILSPRAEPPDAAAWEGGATSEGRLHARAIPSTDPTAAPLHLVLRHVHPNGHGRPPRCRALQMPVVLRAARGGALDHRAIGGGSATQAIQLKYAAPRSMRRRRPPSAVPSRWAAPPYPAHLTREARAARRRGGRGDVAPNAIGDRDGGGCSPGRRARRPR